MTQPWPVPPAPTRSRNWLAVALGILTTVLAAAALIVALTRSGPEPVPTYTAAQKAEAKTTLCERYKLAGQAVHTETAPNADLALARVALTNGALILDVAADNPALDTKYRAAARSLADSYQTMAAVASSVAADSLEWHRAVDDAVAKDSTMKGLCGD